MKPLLKNIRSIAGLLLLGLFAWFFTDLFIYICLAVVVSIMGRPLVRVISLIRIKNFQFGNTGGALITMALLLALISFFILFLGPLIGTQAYIVSSIDTNLISTYYEGFFHDLNEYLSNYGFLQAGQDVFSLAQTELKNLVSFSYVSQAFGSVISITGSFFMAFSIVLFLSFFFLKEPELVRNFILWITPKAHQEVARQILMESRKLLSRYFIGLMIDLFSMMVIISSILALFGINNAILIGFIGGIMNIIPYLGPLIGAVAGTLLGIIYVLANGYFDQLAYTATIIIGAFVFANLVDNFVLQPVIYSKSVKAHPIEIFLVIIIGGNIGGIVGMIAAVPTYTVIKVIFNQYTKSFENGPS